MPVNNTSKARAKVGKEKNSLRVGNFCKLRECDCKKMKIDIEGKKQPKKHQGQGKLNITCKEGIQISVWNKGGARDTGFNDKRDEIEMYLKSENIAVMGVCEANIGAENENYNIDSYVSVLDGNKCHQSSSKIVIICNSHQLCMSATLQILALYRVPEQRVSTQS